MAKKSVNLLPAFFRTDKNSKFLSSTLDQFIETPQLERLDGFIGSKLSKNFNPAVDQYITDPQPLRTKYQLEPGLIIKELDGSIKKAYGYDDLINQISFQGGNVDNLNSIFEPDFYSYDPHVDWDKLVDFGSYYWLPTGPAPIKITGTQRELVSTFTVTDDPNGYFVFTPDGLTPDPQLVLYRGVTYVFNVNSANNLYVRLVAGSGSNNLYTTDITGNGTSQIILSVTSTTPNVLYYATDANDISGGEIVIRTIDENSYIDVDAEIVGKSQYKSGTGVEFINGLRVNFGGDVKPASYRNKDFIVEGVGDKITLVDYASLETPESIATQYDVDFDAENFDDFPFDNFKNIPLEPSYITINRASKDLNPWTRYNRWFHADVLRSVAAAAGEVATLPVENRARRPIIEFKPNLQLYNFGNKAIANVDLLDTTTKDVFSNVEKSPGYWVDNVELAEGYRVIFNADTDPLVRGKIYEVTFVTIEGERRINLVEPSDNVPFLNACVTVTQGAAYSGSTWWFTSDNVWANGQAKTSLNQAPLFDIFDSNGYSYGGSPYTSDFRGTKIFGYAVGHGANDPVLGIPLKYKSTGIESSYLFTNYYTTDVINRVFPDISITIPVSAGFLKSNESLTTPAYINVWRDAVDFKLPVIQFQELFVETSNIEITTFDNPGYIDDLSVDVFINDNKTSEFELVASNEKLYVQFNTALSASTYGNRVELRIYSATAPNITGAYQTPVNLTNNPLNGPVSELTLSELYDHVNTMVERDPAFTGVFPGANNLGRLPFVAKYGTRIIANKNPLSMAHYFISNKDHNVIEALKLSSDNYNQFKLSFIKALSGVEDYSDIPTAVDNVMTELNQNKTTTFPYATSDMVPYGTNRKVRTYTVTDSRNLDYSITSVFDASALSNKAILVYLNNQQLIKDREYYFQPYDTTVSLRVNVVKGDVITIAEYIDTDSNYVAPTPTKLGLYPKFEPMKYLDSSYAGAPQNVIQGHDGSLLVAFNDYRDDLIIEFEKRIYNNIKTTYNASLFDINTVLPGAFRKEEYTYSQTYNLVQSLFLQWVSLYGINYEENTTYDINNHKTYNFKDATDYIFNKSLPGSWRAIYKYYFDTDRPNTHPWEMLGISVKPEWWDTRYGTAPYTAGNLTMWQDIELGRVADGDNAGINHLYARPGLSQIIPVDDSGNIIDPRNWASLALNNSIDNTDQQWAFGDIGPAENAWRRSSYYPFAVQIMLALAKPADYAAKLFDTSRMILNNAGQFTYGDMNQFLTPSILSLPGDIVNSVVTRTAGYSVYVVESGKIKSTGYTAMLKKELQNSNFNLFTKLGGFVSKDKLDIVIDAVQLNSQNPTPYMPDEDYTIHFNVSNPIKTIAISGIIVIKSKGKFIVRGYDNKDLFFNIYNPIHQLSDSAFSVGAKSEEFVTWTANQYYSAGQIVLYGTTYYRTISNHNSLSTFDSKYYRALSVLPSVGGTVVSTASKFETEVTKVSYSTAYNTVQEVYDFLIGYNHWLLEQGFVFDDYNEEFQQTLDWTFTAKEFIYWTTQNWSDNSVITLSPFANQLKFTFQEGVVDNIFDSFYDYSLLRADGTSFPAKNFSLVRDANVFTIKTRSTYDGIFFARLNVVQKEHTLVFNNTTIFSDVLYNINTGYRQLRVKLKGFRTAEWNGNFISPGFVYDLASVSPWTAYTDYLPGDVVEYVGKYYSARKKISGTQTFDFSLWVLLPERPVAQLLPNFEYKISQFEDFYSLDIDNFDLAQQQMAQHLIGYSSRNYLENIFDNPISQYKFYQGFIKEKGTRNALTKLEKASVTNLQGKIEFNEEWAFRLGFYGSYSSYNEIELPLREDEFAENNQLVQFVDSIPTSINVLNSYITPADLTLKPEDYSANSTFIVKDGTFDSANFVLPSAGYVRLDDVQHVYKTIDDLIAESDNTTFKESDKIWIGFETSGEWNVYRYTRQLCFAKTAELGPSDTVIFTTNKNHGMNIGQLVSVVNMDTTVDGIYTIKDVTALNQFTVTRAIVALPDTFSNGQMFVFNSVRLPNVDAIADVPHLANIHTDELFWVDNNPVSKWSVYKKIDNYDYVEQVAPRNKPGQQFGYQIATQANSSTVVVSANQFYDIAGGYGRIYVYNNTDGGLSQITNYSLNEYTDEYRVSGDRAGFGDTLVYDGSDDIIFAAASRASFITTATVFKTPGLSTAYDIGLVKISGVHRVSGVELPYDVITSSNATRDGEQFGASIVVQKQTSNKRVLIGAPGHYTTATGSSTATGIVYAYDFNITPTVRTLTTITGVTNNVGSGASFDVSIDNLSYSVVVNNTGTGYTTSSVITISGEALGGKHPHNDLRIQVLTTNGSGSIERCKVVFNSVAAIRSTEVSTATQASLPMPIDWELTRAEFGSSMAADTLATTVAVAAPGYGNNTGAVYIYRYNNSAYVLSQTIKARDEAFGSLVQRSSRFGESLAMSDDGQYLFAGAPVMNDGVNMPGKVAVYKNVNNYFTLVQFLDNPTRDPNLLFGSSISVNSTGTVLAIAAQGDNLFNSMTFDDSSTTFDDQSCSFGDLVRQSGSVYVYNRYDNNFLLAQELFDNTVDNNSHYGESVVVTDTTVFVGSPGSIVGNTPNGSLYPWTEIDSAKNSWSIFREQDSLVDVGLIKKAYTLDTLSETVVDYLDVIDPLKGKIAGIADQEVRYKAPFDPATYSVGTSSVLSDSTGYWADNQVGELWWDLSTVKYVWYEQGDLAYRKSTWGQLFPGATIDVYEWVKTEYPPSQWASLADTTAGLTIGISGQPKNTDDTVYSSREVYDKNTNQFTTVYYYWVKGKTIVPNHQDRRISAYEVATLIENPRSVGVKYLSVVSSNAVVLANFKTNLISDRIYLNIGFDNINNSVNKHTEWALIQEGNENSQPPALLEKKLLDSLLGKDSLGNPVPDPSLPTRQRYGVEIRPKQTMFVDRISALRNMIDYTNSVLATTLTRGYIDFGNLNSKEEIPDIIFGQYDKIYEDIEGRDTLVTQQLKQAELVCEVADGKLSFITVIDPGYGYVTAPTVEILNDLSGAKIKTEIDSDTGKVISATVVNPGRNFITAPQLLTRPYTVIVQIDPDFNNKWSKYEWSGSNWVRIHTQNFDTTKYWEYIDWVDSSYNSLKPLVYTVDELYQVQELDLVAGDYVKVKNPGDSFYMILRKTDVNVAGSYSTDFDIIYKEQGTIQILSSVWDTTSAQLGYDNVTTFDQLVYDQTADMELQRILAAIKDDIFSGSMRVYWNKFFFRAVKYALTEQRFLDWAFKTSFINVRNIAGVLDQRSTYRFQDPTWYEDYLKEIKPYHTKIRNYQLNYQVGTDANTPWEASNTYTTDFDLPAVYNKASKSFDTVTQSDSLINSYPYKGWADNYTFEVADISLASNGNGYKVTPNVSIIPAPGDTGTGATAIAYIAFGKIKEIELTNPGQGYTRTPTVVISGGGDTALEPAVAYANLTNKRVRSNKIGIKFDRISSDRTVGSKSVNYVTTASGFTFTFDLPWYASTNKDNILIKLDGIIVLDPDYSINNYTEVDGYHKKRSQLVLVNVPTKGQVIDITYDKNIEIYSAAERVQDYYNPAAGMPGNQLGQVMEGVDYPGLKLDTLPFTYSANWDTMPFGQSAWDADPTGLTDLDTVVDGGDIQRTTARGIKASDIILDGDGFVTPYTSHAPEEMVPGQVRESVSISVFTRQEKGSPVIVSQSSLISSTDTVTTIDLRLQPANTSSVMVSFNSKALVYGRDYNVNFVDKTVTINTQTTTGQAAITIVGVGGTEMLGSSVATVSTSTVSFETPTLLSSIGSVYVTANGVTLTQTSGTGLGYKLVPAATKKKKPTLVVTGLGDGPTIVQAWYFVPTYKAYSEVKEQIISVETTATTFELIQMPGTLGPFHAQAVVELNGLRLTPPDTTYYQVANGQTVFDIRPDEVSAPGIFDLSQLEVHVNGIKLTSGVDFFLDQPSNQVVFNESYLANGDVLAITTLLLSDYKIENGQIVLSTAVQPGELLKIVTYTNQDASNIRTEVYTVSGTRLYRMARPILNSSYVWVSIAGKPLINNLDYAILSDRITIELSAAYPASLGSKLVITSFSDVTSNASIGYRIFKDLLGRTHYKRYSEQNTAYLTQPLSINDTEIYVDNGVVLPVPLPAQNTPGVVFVAGERIEYYSKQGNVLSTLNRATLGTGAKDVYVVGTAVVDQGKAQTIPFTDKVVTQSFTTTNTTSYVITDIGVSANSYNELEVYYAGRLLSKTSKVVHNYEASYDSSTATDIILAPDFTISTATNTLDLSFLPEIDKVLTVASRSGYIWYDRGVDTPTDGQSLLQSTTAQAEFLLERQAGLPDKYQYGQS